MRTTRQIKAEIAQRFGFVSPFFELAQPSPQVLENLWQQTLLAYVDNPLPGILKEKLSAYLSRYCAVPYCMICHSCSLYGMGVQAQDILQLLTSTPPTAAEIETHLERLGGFGGSSSITLQELDPALEESLLWCAISIGLDGNQVECRRHLFEFLGAEGYQHLVALIAYIKTCSVWLEAHPEVSYQEDKRVQDHLERLLAAGPGLAEFFDNHSHRVMAEGLKQSDQPLEAFVQTERVSLERVIKEQESIVEVLLDVFYRLDLEGNLVCWNQKLETLTGLSPRELAGRSALRFFPESERTTIASAIREVFDKGKAMAQGHLIGQGDELLLHEWSGVRLQDETGKVIGITGIGRDITQRKHIEQQLYYSAFHDALTGLPNRALLINQLKDLLTEPNSSKAELFAVLFLDVDRFKVINDSLGHSLGDQLLVAIAGRLEACLRPADIAARMGGDKFIILLKNLPQASNAVLAAKRIQDHLRFPFVLGGQKVSITVSVGIAFCGKVSDQATYTYQQPEGLLQDADIAMYKAKAQGKARHQIFQPKMRAQAIARLQIENDLRQGIEQQQLRVFYQPVVLLETGVIIGFEALVRWQHPQRGLLSPGEFLPVAEEAGLMVAIDQWVLHEACEQLHRWQGQFTDSSLSISVNLDSNRFNLPNLVEQVSQTLQESGLSAASLKLEITENVLMENAQEATATLTQLQALGIELAIDDFGTGYSSLARLHQLPISELKIDRSFLKQEENSEAKLELVKIVLSLADHLNLSVTAEGVETAEQLQQLQGLNCKYGQGYFFARPLAAPEAEALLVTQPHWQQKILQE